ncbi:hypothetical protein TrLO_g12420 [Triparma laevis f. longispina]|uniref:Uncharacterized protein n=1 Tax=Triparma laevis f. longispina TaxID=1714387 RepID=A0A9W6ZY76_9STRA|nr:hypothetical protein TrLO_g12420 [Triparma laevis f. longispina]
MDTVTIGTQLLGASKFYGMTIIAASSGFWGASGSGIYTNGKLLTSQPDNTNAQCSMLMPDFPQNSVWFFPSRACEATYSATVSSVPVPSRATNRVDVSTSPFNNANNASGWPTYIIDGEIAPSSLAIGVPKLINTIQALGHPLGPGYTYSDTSNTSQTVTVLNQNANSILLPPPTENGTYTKSLRSPTGDTVCTITADFPSGTASGGEAYYILKAWDSTGNADSTLNGMIFQNNNCPIVLAGCSFARCVGTHHASGTCITVPDLLGLFSAPEETAVPSSVTLLANFSGSKFVYPMVTDAMLQPVADLDEDVEMSGPLSIDDFYDQNEQRIMLDRTIVSVEGGGDRSFMSLAGFEANFQNPQDCTICSDPYNFYDFSASRSVAWPPSFRGFICSKYDDL